MYAVRSPSKRNSAVSPVTLYAPRPPLVDEAVAYAVVVGAELDREAISSAAEVYYGGVIYVCDMRLPV